MTNEHSDAAFIPMVANDEADDNLLALIEANSDRANGKLDNILRIHTLSPKGLVGHLGIYEAAMAGTKTLRKVERELVALIVSDINECHY